MEVPVRRKKGKIKDKISGFGERYGADWCDKREI